MIENIINSIIKIPLPSCEQEKEHTCGVAALSSILSYFCGEITEKEIVKKISLKEKDGLDPYEIIDVLKKYNNECNLKYKQYRQMTIEQLKKCILERKPVLIMLQAWGKRYWKNAYKYYWKSGHWIIAVGYDKNNFYFEDPSIEYEEGLLGYIPIDSLYHRWHDYEKYHKNDNEYLHHTDQYGIAIWKEGFKNRNRKHITYKALFIN